MDNKEITILVDIDDTIEDLIGAWCAWLNSHYSTDVLPDQITQWDMHMAFPTLSHNQIYAPLDRLDFWQTVKPRKDAMKYLKKLYDWGYDIYLCTSTSYKNVAIKYEKIVQKYFPYIDWEHIIVAGDKTMIKGDIMVDDGIHNLLGGDYLKILMSLPHNKFFDAKENGVIRVSDWSEATDIITSYKEYGRRILY